ncbi:MAG: DNA integrity scanning protein DisA nucleotide-binding domain protein [Methanosarcinaceae archaeon]
MDTTEIIAASALKIAEELGACAIVISGNVYLDETTTDIPIYFVSRRPKNIIDNLFTGNSEDLGKTKKITEGINTQTAGYIEHVEHTAAIEHLIGDLKKGIIVGIIESMDSSAIIVHDITQSPMLKAIGECEERVPAGVIRSLLTIALDIAETGREGRKVGTAFVVGDAEEVMQRSHQIILNPYVGHPDEEKDVRIKNNWESIKEFALLDGVFVVSGEGLFIAAGRYLDINAKGININKGLGGRHVSAAAITRDTVAIAVTISESGGVVRIYMDGKELLCIDSAGRAIQYERD